MNKWTKWHDSLPAHTREYLKTQAIWHDIDLAKALAVGLAIGFFIGWAI
jgi:hypothetical protein